MADTKTLEPKIIELWDGFKVEVDMQLIDDFDFTSDLQKAMKENDAATLVTMYMALVGGDETYEKVRKHIEDECGYFSQKEILKIMEKIDDAFPKSGNRAQRRSWNRSA